MKILIIEDEEPAAQRLQQLIKKLVPGSEILDVVDSVNRAVQWFKTHPQPDLVMMDIQLSDGISFSILEQVSIESPVIFTTAYDEYVMRSFRLNSIDYLLKPVEEEKLRSAINKLTVISSFYDPSGNAARWKELMQSFMSGSTYRTRFLVSKADQWIPVSTSEISYFFAEEKAVWIVTKKNQRHLVDQTLDKLESELDPRHFFRANRSYLLSAGSVVRIQNYFYFKLKIDVDPQTSGDIIVSREKARSFKHWLNS